MKYRCHVSYDMSHVIVIWHICIYIYCRLELFCAGKYLRRWQETWMGKFLRSKFFAKIYHNYNHYITIEIFGDYIFAILNIRKKKQQKSQKYFVANKFQSTVLVISDIFISIQRTAHTVLPPLPMSRHRKSLLTRLHWNSACCAVWLWDHPRVSTDTSAGVQSLVVSCTRVGYAHMKTHSPPVWDVTWDVTR